ncbi:MAG: hypothetical protein QGH39_08910 [Candidatus Thermoplasmatota archaeon]|jgi:hypothetical protein|nr:hypothetical protein [Candidatus Thermoplasmatota archaeon]MDP7265661.1 hypothetical protein [Candidatus Thermoplasmatota archaeon]
MRRVTLDEWLKTSPPKSEKRGRRGVRRRPTTRWKLIDSINFIRMRNEYLERKGILVRTGDRRWRIQWTSKN